MTYRDVYDSPLSEQALSKDRIPRAPSDPRVVYNLVRDELSLDGDASQNLATFCTTWSEPEVHRLMDASLTKNMIHKEANPEQRARASERRPAALVGSAPGDRLSTGGVKTTVVIIGAGPAGAMLSLLLTDAGVDNVVLERRSRAYVLGRIRAGVLESGTVQMLRDAGVGDRMDRDGHPHDTVNIAWRGEDLLSVDTVGLIGKRMMAYGQTAIQTDLYDALDQRDRSPVFEAADVALHDVTSDAPHVTFTAGSGTERIDCELIAGCDGSHGVSRTIIPAGVMREYEKDYPFGWIGILSETPPLPILVYANHERGFALCSMRNPMLSRYYVQCPLDDTVDDWPDDRFWTELLARLPAAQREQIVTGPSIEKSITPLRSYVQEPMRHGNLFLAGDAAHIVPPTGAKGLNLAFSDVYYLSSAIIERYHSGSPEGLDAYSDRALARAWGSARFSWWLTTLLHRFPGQTAFDQRAQEQELSYLASSTAYQRVMAEQYTGLPF